MSESNSNVIPAINAQTIVMITHNEEIAQMADSIIRIEDGRIVSQN